MLKNAKNPLVTIGIPFFNPGHALVDAVRSVFAQSFQDWELILMDDGSTDGSLELARRIQDPRVHVVSDGKNLGLVARLNQITQLASGTYLARMDADDLMHPERIAKQYNFLKSNTQVDVIDTGAFILNKEGYPVGLRGTSPGLPTPLALLKWGGFLHPSIMTRREWLLSHQYDPAYPRAEDRELWARTFKSSKFAHLQEALFFYRLVGNVRPRLYLTSYSSERKVLLKHGPNLVGWPWAVALYIRSLAKSAVLLGLSSLKKEQLVASRMYNPIDKTSLSVAVEVLQKIREQRVPGW
ncbi:glycosyltransferase family 2 protein [Calidithermus timidus]|jgi:glycosyltransferase involved in cell wall biosynthesis|uniref:glycosyltransferase family 2 protein n=1 Tax=Calidithermus timidus TaxID=307124 RepID=UPI000A0771E9|nr:glycosyltransferase [Calidithermus timidus]